MKSIDYEIQRLLAIKQTVDNFNAGRKNSDVVLLPVSKSFYDKLANENKLVSDVLYYILDKDIGQYIECYIE
jgi:hypothetical protein